MKLFINYDYDDRDYVNQLIGNLEAAAFDVAYFASALQVTNDWDQIILQHVKECDTFIYLISPGSLQSPFCKVLYEYASELNKSILTVLLRPTLEWKSLSEDQVNLASLDLNQVANVNDALFLVVAGLNKLVMSPNQDNSAILEKQILKPDLRELNPVIWDSEPVSQTTSQMIVQTRQSYIIPLLVSITGSLIVTIGILLLLNWQSLTAEVSAQVTLNAFATPVPFSGVNFSEVVIPTPDIVKNNCNHNVINPEAISISNVITTLGLVANCNLFIDSRVITDYKARIGINFSEFPEEYSLWQAISITQDNRIFYCGLQAVASNAVDVSSGISAAFWSGTTDSAGNYTLEFLNTVASNGTNLVPNFLFDSNYEFTLTVDSEGIIRCSVESFVIPARPADTSFSPRLRREDNVGLYLSSYRENTEARSIVEDLQYRP